MEEIAFERDLSTFRWENKGSYRRDGANLQGGHQKQMDSQG